MLCRRCGQEGVFDVTCTTATKTYRNCGVVTLSVDQSRKSSSTPIITRRAGSSGRVACWRHFANLATKYLQVELRTFLTSTVKQATPVPSPVLPARSSSCNRSAATTRNADSCRAYSAPITTNDSTPPSLSPKFRAGPTSGPTAAARGLIEDAPAGSASAVRNGFVRWLTPACSW